MAWTVGLSNYGQQSTVVSHGRCALEEPLLERNFNDFNVSHATFMRRASDVHAMRMRRASLAQAWFMRCSCDVHATLMRRVCDDHATGMRWVCDVMR